MKNVFIKTVIPLFLAFITVISVGAQPSVIRDNEYISEAVSEDVSAEDIVIDAEHFGDVNDDGKINASDARMLLRCAATLEETTYIVRSRGDYNRDGIINASDARSGLRVAAMIDSIECIFNGHTYEKYTVRPTCTSEGYVTNKCVRCSATDGSKSDIVSANGHKISTSKTAATCTSAGWIKEVCTVCGFVQKDCADGNALGHKYGEWVLALT